MTDVIVQGKDVIVEVQQPTIPPAAPPPKIGLIEINQVVARGTAWMTGNGPPTAAGGQYGDMYLDATTGDMYQWDGSAWQYIGTFAPSTDTPAEVLAKIVTVDGAGSGLDADLLDGHDSPYFATQTDMTAVQAKNTSQDTAISGNTSSISANANAISDLQTATTPANLLTSIKTVDGSGSGLDADTLDGHDTAYFGTAAADTAETNARTAADTTLQNNINLKANIASPVFTGDPQAPTPAVSDNDTSIATTAFVKSVTATIVPFPEAPQDGLTYGRKNATWSTVIGGAATSDTAPPGPLVTGQLWWKSDTGTFYVYYNDGNSSQWVEAAAPAVPAAAYAMKTARRANLMINGALNVSQENGNTEGVSINGYYAADQFFSNVNAAPAAYGFGRIVSANVSGSQYRLQFRVTTAKASLAAGDVASIQTRLEGLNMQDLAWVQPAFGTPMPKDAVLAFGFNGPAGTYAISIRNAALTYTFVASFTITAGQAGVDTAQVIKIPAPPFSMGPWATDNTVGMYITFTLAAGSTGLAPTTGWQAGNFTGVTGMSNGLAAVQSFQIWDLYFGADPDKTGVPPVFEVPDYATELAKCLRYYEAGNYSFIGYQAAGSTIAGSIPFLASKRATPSMTANTGSITNVTGASVSPNTSMNYSAAGTATATGVVVSTGAYKASARM
jgi:hypothetical protein